MADNSLAGEVYVSEDEDYTTTNPSSNNQRHHQKNNQGRCNGDHATPIVRASSPLSTVPHVMTQYNIPSNIHSHDKADAAKMK